VPTLPATFNDETSPGCLKEPPNCNIHHYILQATAI
jgi:hypothetical protein